MEKDFIKKWLKSHQHCVLTTSFKDKPWAATVNYAVDDNLNLYISTSPNSLKFQNILKNPQVCLVVDSQNRKGTLRIEGVAKPLSPKNKEEPNVLIRPKTLIFLKQKESGEFEKIELKL